MFCFSFVGEGLGFTGFRPVDGSNLASLQTGIAVSRNQEPFLESFCRCSGEIQIPETTQGTG